jgi:DNA-binding MarR family transcriptional regulator
MSLRSAAQSLTRTYDAALSPAGVNANQFSLMNLIRTAEDPSVRALADISDLDHSTLVRNLKVLEKRGLVAMRAGKDARTRVVELTRDGRATLRTATPLWQGVQNDFLEKLGEDKRADLKNMLSALTAGS